METYISRKLVTLLSLTLLWGLTGVLANIQIPQRRIDVTKGKMVVLRAFNPGPEVRKNSVIWSYVANNSQMIISYTPDSGGSISMGGSTQFQGRVGFTASMPSANLSLYINNTREADSGRYSCTVIIPSSGQDAGLGLIEEIILDVKVPPAVPQCTMSGKPVLKGNVTLSCKSKSGKPIPTYKWKRSSPNSQFFFAPQQNEITGTLKLSNLSSNMSGKYACTASNTAGVERCYIDLEIITSTNAGVIAGATVGSILGFILVIFVLIFLLKRRRDSEDDLANDIKEDAQAPKRVSWAKSGTGSDIVSKNGTLSSITSSPHQRELSHHNNHHPHLQQYPQRPPSDTASIITATGSVAGYHPRQGPSPSSHALPTSFSYNNSSTLPRDPPGHSSNGGSPLPRTERSTPIPQAQPAPQNYAQVQRPPLLPTSVVSTSNISRMGGVPIMVPAQNQAGSLV